MREVCEKCQGPLPNDTANALICSFECTFCTSCAVGMDATCPNCGGELVPRPRRLEAAA